MTAHLYLGFDGGGTKTECALLDTSGRVLGQGSGGPSNALRAGFEAAFASLAQAANEALASAKSRREELCAVCAGLAGAGRASVAQRVTLFLQEQFAQASVQVISDFDAALEAAGGAGAAVVLIAGTGSVAVGRDATGRTIRAGGLGPWIGDEGSAFDIGRRAVMAVARLRDALGPPTSLAELILTRLECSAWEQLVERIAQKPDEVFPRLFPVVAEAAEAGDAVAREILERAAAELSFIARSVIRRLGLAGEEFVVAKSGGVHGRSPILDSALDQHLRAAAPQAKIGPLPVPACVGAARLAMRMYPPRPTEALRGQRP